MAKFFEALFNGTTTLDAYAPDTGGAITAIEVDLNNSSFSNVGDVPAASAMEVSGGMLRFPDTLVGKIVALKLGTDSPTQDYSVEVEMDLNPVQNYLFILFALRGATPGVPAWAFAKHFIGGEVDFQQIANFSPYANWADGEDTYAYESGVDLGPYADESRTFVLKVEVVGGVVSLYVDGVLAKQLTPSLPTPPLAGRETYIVLDFNQSGPETGGGYILTPIRRITAETYEAPPDPIFVTSRLVKAYTPAVPATNGTPYQPPYCVTVMTGTVWQSFWVDVPVFGIGAVAPGTLTPEQVEAILDSLENVTVRKDFGRYVPLYQKVCLPEVRGVLPTNAVPTNYHLGWTGAAASIPVLGSQGQYKFSVPKNVVGVVTGLNDNNEGVGYPEIDYGLYFFSGRVIVIEGGEQRIPTYSYISDDVFRIVRIGSQIRYFKNRTLLYTSSIFTASGSYRADAALFAAGDEIDNAEILDAFTEEEIADGFADSEGATSGTGTTDGIVDDSGEEGLNCVLGPFVGFSMAGSVTEGGFVSGILRRFTGAAESYNNPGEVAAELTDFVGESYGTLLGGVVSARLADFGAAAGANLLTPDYSLVSANLMPLQGFALVPNYPGGAEVDGVLGPFRAYAVAGSLTEWNTTQECRLYKFVGFSFTADTQAQIHAYFELPLLRTRMEINAGNSLRGVVELPGFEVEGWTGGEAVVDLPALLVSGEGDIDNVVRGQITLPALDASGTGFIGTILQGSIRLPGLQIQSRAGFSAYGNWGLSAQPGIYLPALQVSARMVENLVATAEFELPLFEIEATATAAVPPTIGYVVLPALLLADNIVGQIVLPALRAAGSASPETQTRRTWVMNLSNNAITEFSNFEFRAMGRAFDRYWGIGMDGGLYLMGGDLDDTEPIAWEWESGITDLGMASVKGLMAVYLDGVIARGVTVTVVSDDARRVYDHVPTGDQNNHKPQRVMLGRGIRSRNFGFGMASLTGAYFELDQLTPEYIVTKRNL